MNIVQLNRIVKQVANCVELVHSYSDSSPYEYWNTENVKYGSICFCIKKTRMRSNTTEYTALMYYGDRLLQDGSNKNEVWSNANDVLQNIIGTLNYTSDGSISVAYPYDITHFEQKFADNLAGAYAQIVITVTGIGECGNLLYGYEGSQEEIKLESIVKTITVNGEYDIVPSNEYDAISDVKVVVNVAPDPMDTFASIGYNEENAGKFLQQFNTDLDIAKMILDNWNSTGSSAVNIDLWKNITTYFPAVDLTMKPNNMYFQFTNWPKLQVVPALDFTGRTSTRQLFYNCNSLKYVGNITGTENVINMADMFNGCRSLTSIPQMDTRNVQSMSDMFYYCNSLTSIPLLDCSSITNTAGPFGYSSLSQLTDLGGFKNLKVSWKSNFLNRVPNATVESLMNVINNIYDLTANGLSGQTLNFGTTNLNKLTDEQKAVATNKGWTLT